jgi:hypothetical protein
MKKLLTKNSKTPLSRKSWVKKLDKLFSQVVTTRDGRCLKCGKTQGIGAAHLYPKGKYTRMRWDTDNAIAMDWNCHLNWAHRDPLGFKDWLDVTLDPKRLSQLKLRAMVADRSPVDYQQIELFLKAELKKYA